MKILIQNGRVIDPASGFDQVCDISLAAGRIIAINRAVADTYLRLIRQKQRRGG